ncbi:MAG: iron ABC transporter permease [Spirochaetes bacterium]|nr:MAG: iron ABC transporter permease [Spirochaetota bacterium]
MKPAEKTILTAALIAVSGAAVVLSLSLGSTFISPYALIQALGGDRDSIEFIILTKLRLPRLFMALAVGASLAVSGALYQSLLRNPLADPYTIGVSGGASLGATVAIVASLSAAWVVFAAFTGAIAVIAAVYLLARRLRMGNTPLILGGIALSFIFSSAVMLLFSVSRAEQVHRALMWLMGDLGIARYAILLPGSLLALALAVLSWAHARQLDILSFGESFAKGLGVSRAEIVRIFWIGSMLAAVSVALAGVIGFVGLIVPHVVRLVSGPGHRRLLPYSALAGGAFLALADAAGRAIVPPYEIPAGVITGFFGGIFFLGLLLARGRDAA